MGAHARLAPSASARWSRCPGSVKRIEALRREHGDVVFMAGRDAAMGTVFHHFLAEVLLGKGEPGDFVGRSRKMRFLGDGGEPVEEHISFDDEMADHARSALALIDDYRLCGADLHVEERVSMEPEVPSCWGTADVVAVFHDARQAAVVDWKYGAGVPVDAEENTQLLLYAFGASKRFFPDFPPEAELELVIFQPRVKPSRRVWRLTVGEMRERVAALGEAAREALSDGARIMPGEKQCQWCPAPRFGACQENFDWHYRQVAGAFDGLEPSGMPREKVAEVLKNAQAIRKWLDVLHEWAVGEHLRGNPLPGMKLVRGRARTVVADKHGLAEQIEAVLGDEGFERKLKTLTDLRRKLGDRFDAVVGPFVRKTEPRFMLVDESDKREAVESVEEAFSSEMDVLAAAKE